MKCSVENCTNEALAKGLCNAHYLRRRKGSPLAPEVKVEKREPSIRKCAVGDCNNPVSEKGGKDLCPKHFKRQLTRTRKEALVKLLGGKCTQCGGEFPSPVFDFHHKNPEEKLFSIGEAIINVSMDDLLEEVKKCELLCANCHRILHHGGF